MAAIFFESLDKVQWASQNLKLFNSQWACRHCGACDCFVSHGFTYKVDADNQKITTGKRIICDARHKGGCGATTRLIVANELPRFNYGAVCVVAFLKALAEGLNIAKAYQTVTGACTSRNAWRWIRKARNQMSAWRTKLSLVGLGPQPCAEADTLPPAPSNPLECSDSKATLQKHDQKLTSPSKKTAALRETLTDLFKLTPPKELCAGLQFELQQALL
jgi:hypothetical protein